MISDWQVHFGCLTFLLCLLGELPLWVAVGTFLGIWDGHGSSVNEGESLIEVWAVLKFIDWGAIRHVVFLLYLLESWSSMWKFFVRLSFLQKLGVLVAVETNLWVWDSSGLTVGESESLIKVWASLKCGKWSTMFGFLSLNKRLLLFLKL